MTTWENERWRKLFVREPKDQEIWEWQTRGLRDLLIRIAEDDGRLGRDVHALRRLLRAGAELDEHVRTLLDDGFLVQDDEGLYVRNLTAAQVQRAPRAPREPSGGGGGGRWANTTPEERKAAARRASDARWGRRTDASGDASPDASVTDATTHDDASSDASSPRAVSGSSEFSESSEIRERREEKTDQRRSRSDASATHDATDAGDASTHVALTHRPRNFAEALRVPIRTRAEVIQRDPHLASYLEPHRWPEVQSVSNALCQSVGRPPRVLASYDRDRGVQAVVTLYASGYEQEALERAARRAPKSSWWTKDGARRGLSDLTPEVVDRALHDPTDARVNDLVRSAREATRQAGPQPLGAALPKFAGGGSNA